MKKPSMNLMIALACSAFTLVSCGTSSESLSSSSESGVSSSSESSSLPVSSSNSTSQDPNNPAISPKYRTYYQILIYSFADSNGDGIGDFKGIADKFDYLKSLGVNGIWLSPAHPASSYHGYNVIDYYYINPNYEVSGYTFDDFLADAEASDIAIVMDLVLNHTSTEYSWFLAGLNAFKNNTESKYKTYYTFSMTQTTQCPNSQNGVYYESLFSSSMPDLNYDNPDVREEAINVGKYWLNKGVSGFRLDGAMHIFTNYASPTFSSDKWNNDIYDKNIAWWNEFYTAMQSVNPDVYCVGEVWSSESKIETYYASGMDDFFNFDTRGKITSAMSGSVDYSAWLETYQTAIRSYNSNAIESYFVDNHDTPRLAVGLNNVSQLKMAAALQLLAPGNAFVFYGDEIGLKGTGGTGDRLYRTPMLWGDSYATNPSLYGIGSSFVSSTVSGVDAMAQVTDQSSLYNYYKNLIALKNTNKELYSGTLEPVLTGSNYYVAYTVTQDEFISLVFHNLSGNVANFNLTGSIFSLSGGMSVSGDAPTLTEGTLSMPGNSTVVIRLSSTDMTVTPILF